MPIRPIPSFEPPPDEMRPVAGVDWSKGGWVVAVLPAAADDTGACIDHQPDFASVRRFVDSHRVARVGIDMPIGLPDRQRRTSDVEARRLLGKRRSSLFWTPSAAVLAATSHAEASDANRERMGSGMSIQAWNLVPGIRQVRRSVAPDESDRFVECHPETSFAVMAGAPLAPKRTARGVGQRLAALRPQVRDLDALLAEAPEQSAIDDALDALAAAWSARRLLRGEARVLGSGHDAVGYPLTIVV